MKNDQGPIHWLKKWLSKDSEDSHPKEKKGKKFHYFLIVLLAGVAFMLISDLWKVDEGDSTAVSLQTKEAEENVPTLGKNSTKGIPKISDFENQYENQLKDALEQIAGVRDVTVVVNVEATGEKVYQKNSSTKNQLTKETDPQGGERTIEDKSSDEQIVIVQEGEKEVPIILETKKPEVSGVLVVAKGADNIQVKKWIIEAVTRALDVPRHKVAVMPK
ncbi:stage III sporulation protein AG [Rossellomorea sp. BNER]|uniref:stage III sporulation protein AG n=1 Tax=Rossellomorea sp. BNER TaxID=2962031 RepID=UPI003AF2EFEE|nr:stage III sporulation protein AG [Rossellomorea sp. BNER]